MKKQNLFGEMVKKAGAKAAVSTANKASVFYCYQPKEPKGLEKFREYPKVCVNLQTDVR